jgi:hypothetical protein
MTSIKYELSPSSYFRPLHSDCSYDEAPSPECVSRGIFRQSRGDMSPPSVCRANPISAMEEDDDDDDSNVSHYELSPCMISPYPLSPSQQELEDRHQLSTQIAFPWQEEKSVAVEPFDYSFYFEPLPDQMDDESIFDDASFEDLQASNSCSFWEDGVMHFNTSMAESNALKVNRTSSPAQISVSSDSDNNGAS